MKREIREKARQLRKQGMSIREITKIVDASKSSVSTWVRDIVLTEEQKDRLKARQSQWAGQNKGAQVNRHRAREKRSLYQEAGRARAREGRPLHMMGCMLYWAEGANDKNRVYFVNSDPNMMLFFMRFLRVEMGVKNTQVKLHIHCHTTNPDDHKRIGRYWLDVLELSESCLMKIQVKKSSDTRRNRLENGVCGIRVQSTELAMHIYGAIQEYAGFDHPDWLY